MDIEQSEIRKAKVLSSGMRINILKLLKQKPHSLSEVAKVLKISKTNAKSHLQKLLDSNLINKNRRSKWTYYSLKPEFAKSVKITVSIALASLLLLIVSIYGVFSNLVKIEDHEYSYSLSFTSWVFFALTVLFGLIFITLALWLVLRKMLEKW